MSDAESHVCRLEGQFQKVLRRGVDVVVRSHPDRRFGPLRPPSPCPPSPPFHVLGPPAVLSVGPHVWTRSCDLGLGWWCSRVSLPVSRLRSQTRTGSGRITHWSTSGVEGVDSLPEPPPRDFSEVKVTRISKRYGSHNFISKGISLEEVPATGAVGGDSDRTTDRVPSMSRAQASFPTHLPSSLDGRSLRRGPGGTEEHGRVDIDGRW